VKSKSLLLVALAFCAVQAQRPSIAVDLAKCRTAMPRVAPPRDALPSDSLNCRLVGYYDAPAIIDGFYAVDTLVYVCVRDSGLFVMDASDPANLVKVGQCSTRNNTPMSLIVEGNYAYVGDAAWLDVIDVSDPTSPSMVGNCFIGWVTGLTKSGNYVYTCTWTLGLHVVDVSNPADPFETGVAPTPTRSVTVAVKGDYAYVADETSGMRVIDVSDKENPAEVFRYDSLGACEGVDIDGNYLYLTEGPALGVFDISTPDAPVRIGACDLAGYASGIDETPDGLAYISAASSGVRVIDVRTPTVPVEVGYYVGATIAEPIFINVFANRMYVADLVATRMNIIDFYAVAVGEGRRPPACSSQLTATIVRGVLWLPAASSSEPQAPSCLLDAVGRRIMRLRPGPNDVRHLGSGVYFVSSPKSVERLVLTR
jgi:hypothetical protein